MKKFVVIFGILFFLLSCSGCGNNVQNGGRNEGKPYVVCTTFSAYDWVREIIGDNSDRVGVRFVGQNSDIHSFQPSLQDIAAVAVSDLLVFVGGESDEWVEKTVREEKLNALCLLDVNKEKLMEEEHSEHSHADNGAVDEHIWLSLRMADASVAAICEKLCELDPQGAESYRKNAENYCKKLSVLDGEYEIAAEKSEDRTVILADRFPFCYMMEDYGIECIAAFPGCSADQDASFEVIARLAAAVDEHDKKTVLVLENSNQTVAKTVIENTKNKNAEIAVMNSCQTIGEQEIAQGASYFEIMEENLEVLKKALE